MAQRLTIRRKKNKRAKGYATPKNKSIQTALSYNKNNDTSPSGIKYLIHNMADMPRELSYIK